MIIRSCRKNWGDHGDVFLVVFVFFKFCRDILRGDVNVFLSSRCEALDMSAFTTRQGMLEQDV